MIGICEAIIGLNDGLRDGLADGLNVGTLVGQRELLLSPLSELTLLGEPTPVGPS